ncbi:putative F-box protein At1g65770 [Mercurialis annua]|uniref:putative F-box protein At1g65770 n=1 Tax=Mercurialis annua TaxID=3986 RepID=UPI002160ED7B|nr:putative F-box protein At1g65770 [Mercurialis annua]
MNKIEWADLPKELLHKIGKCIDSRLDLIRFRSVCSSWRSSVSTSHFDQEIPNLSFKLPHPINLAAVLHQSTVCRLQFLTHHKLKLPNSCSCSSSSNSNSKGWLVKVQESKFGKLDLLNPLSDYKIRYSPIVLNLLDVSFVKLSDAFMLKTPSGYSVLGVNKAVLFSKDVLSILAIYHDGKLGYWKIGDEEWTILDDANFEYDDIIEFKGQFYVIDRWGTVSWIDKSLNIIQYSPPLFGCGAQKNLAESCGYLYIVDRYLDGKKTPWNHDVPVRRWRRRRRKNIPNTISFRVYKLDEEWGKWVDVNSLDDRVFILGMDCSLSISSSEFVGGKGNCIYFTEEDDDFTGKGLSSDSIRVFLLDDRVIDKVSAWPEFAEIFWPPRISSNATNASPDD